MEFPDYLLKPSQFTPELCMKNQNGCGTAGWKGKLVPDIIYGISIKPACAIHDLDYALNSELIFKNTADIRFLHNMNKIFKNEATWKSRWLNPLRRRRALKYYWAVKYGGEEAFLEAKLVE